MIEKIKQLIYKIPHGLIPMVIVGICTLIGGFISFLVYYKTPVSLNDEKDSTAIFNLIQEQHPACEILNVELCDTITLYPVTFDSIYKKSNQINDEEDVFWYTKSVDYNVVSENDTMAYRLVFEITEKFLHNEVGQYLFIVDKKNQKIIY